MAVQLQFTENYAFADGDFAPGALVRFFLTGSTTPVTVYSDPERTTPHPTPLVADAAGRFPAAWGEDGINLRAVVTKANGSPISDLDPIVLGNTSSQSATGIAFTPVSGNPATNVQDAVANVSPSEFMRTVNDDLTAEAARLTLGAAASASPNLTGVPKATTAAIGTETGQIATTQFVANAIGAFGGIAYDVQEFTADADWSKPESAADTDFVIVWGVGGGGAGGFDAGGAAEAGGGVGGYGGFYRFSMADLNATEAVVIGAGGAGIIANGAGGNGGDTTMAGLTFGGGEGGKNNYAATSRAQGRFLSKRLPDDGGNGAYGEFGNGLMVAEGSMYGGGGGDGGASMNAGNGGSAGADGDFPGGGGSGVATGTSGAGAAGVLRVYCYRTITS